MKNYLDDLRLGCVFGPLVKSMKEYLDVKDVLLEENEELFLESSLLKRINQVLCWRVHNVEEVSYEMSIVP